MINYIFGEFIHLINIMRTTYPFDDFNTISLFDFVVSLLFVSITVEIFVGGSNNNAQ